MRVGKRGERKTERRPGFSARTGRGGAAGGELPIKFHTCAEQQNAALELRQSKHRAKHIERGWRQHRGAGLA